MLPVKFLPGKKLLEAAPVDVPKRVLDDPGPCLVLTLKTFEDGKSKIQYVGEPEWAVSVLRGMADQIEKDTKTDG